MEQHLTQMRTALYEEHCKWHAKMVEFFGWEMPLFYKGIIHEHHAVRKGVGLFDVSHMGRVLVAGKDAGALLDYLSTNHIAARPDFSAIYTTWANEEGGCVDDVIVYKQDADHYFVIVNASNRQKDLEHLKRAAFTISSGIGRLQSASAKGRSSEIADAIPSSRSLASASFRAADSCDEIMKVALKRYASTYQASVKDLFDTDGILAVQGPRAWELVQTLLPDARRMKPMHFQIGNYRNAQIIVSSTGYTGAGGVEIYGPNGQIVELWKALLEEGKKFDIEPIGLGARDTLRLEKGYALYGHELSDNIAPTESVAAWTVQFDKKDFLGKGKLEALEKNPAKRSAYGMVLLDKGIAREGSQVYDGQKLIGKVTSGTFSPTLNKSIALILVQGQYKTGDKLFAEVRGQRLLAEVAALPFL